MPFPCIDPVEEETMSDENKDDKQEQQDFLNSHEELLNSINKKKENPDTITPMQYANIGCDGDANSCIELGRLSDAFKPLPGYKTML